MSNGSSIGSTKTPQPDDVLARTGGNVLADAAFEAGFERGYQAGFKNGMDTGIKARCENQYNQGYKDGLEIGRKEPKVKKEKTGRTRPK